MAMSRFHAPAASMANGKSAVATSTVQAGYQQVSESGSRQLSTSDTRQSTSSAGFEAPPAEAATAAVPSGGAPSAPSESVHTIDDDDDGDEDEAGTAASGADSSAAVSVNSTPAANTPAQTAALGNVASSDHQERGAGAVTHPDPSHGERIFAEWLERMRQIMEHDHLRVLDLFRECDRNSDGVVTKDELASFLRMSKIPMSDDDLVAIMAVIDADHNGQIDYQEFARRVYNRHILQAKEKDQQLTVGRMSDAAAPAGVDSQVKSPPAVPDSPVNLAGSPTQPTAPTIAAPAPPPASGAALPTTTGGSTTAAPAANTLDGQALTDNFVRLMNEESSQDQRDALLQAFLKEDKEGTGKVSRSAFRTIVRAARPNDLPLREVNQIVSHLDHEGTMQVPYAALAISWQKSPV